MKELWQSLNKVYFTTSLMVFALVLSITLTFLIEFKVEALQDEIAKTESEIATYQDEIQLLEVEWTYLTRPSRLRSLAAQYLQNNGYALAAQIKDANQLEKYYLVSYKKNAQEQDELAASDDLDSRQVSF